MARTNKYSDNRIIGAIRHTKGLVYLAAEQLGCNVSLIHHRAAKNPKIRQIIEEERNKILDLGELKLLKSVNDGEAWAVCFLLKTQGRKRGYVERQEIRQESKVTVTASAEEMTDDELAAIATGRSPRIVKKEEGEEEPH